MSIKNSQFIQHPNSILKRNTKTSKGSNFTFKNTPQDNNGDSMAQLSSLEQQLASIRENLQPLMHQYQNIPFGGGPHAELMELATGRLIKVHSEKLNSLIIDDIIEETIHMLNGLESINERKRQERDLKSALKQLMTNVGEMDINQRHFHQNSIGLKQMMQNMKYGAIPKREGAQYEVGQDPISKLSSEITLGLALRNGGGRNTAGYDSLIREKSMVSIDPQVLMKITRDQIMHEDRINEIPILKPSYVKKAVQTSEDVIEGIILEIVRNFGSAGDQFLTEVIKSEIR